MSDAKHTPACLRKPAIVAVIAGLEDLRVWKDSAGVADLFELRLDLLLPAKPDLSPAFFAPVKPLLITARDPSEGGAPQLTQQDRLRALWNWLEAAAWLDIEARNLSAYADLLVAARIAGKQIVISYHDFERTPRVHELEAVLASLVVDGPFIFKVVTWASTWSDLSNLTNFLLNHPEREIAVMGMGPLGKLSRLVLPAFGSRLVYASLATAVVSGQWPAEVLRSTLEALDLWEAAARS